MMWLLRNTLCRLGLCLPVHLHDVPEGIGGKCAACGKLHGWMSRDELIAISYRYF